MTQKSRIAAILDRASDCVRPFIPERFGTGRLLRRIRARLPSQRRADTPFVRKLDRFVRQFGAAFPEARFVQVGSNDGKHLDPLSQQILSRQWTGIMLEPVPYIFKRLEANYGHLDRLQLLNEAIADHDGVQEFYYLSQAGPDEELPAWYDTLGSFRKDVILSHEEAIPDVATRVTSLQVPCVTFETLCTRLGVTELDLVHVDAEGYDFEVLKLIDFGRLRPALVIFENYHMDSATYAAASQLLQGFGYELLDEGMDTLALDVDRARAKQPQLASLWRELRQEP
jgi:FkbM family methyltransferase